MSKPARKKVSKTNASERPTPASKRTSHGGGATMDSESDGDMSEGLEFEDPYGDEYAEEVIVDEKTAEAEANGAAGPKRVWRAGIDPIAEDEQLDFDPTAYTLFHKLKVEWPCLSIDILRDSLGAYRTKLPASLYMVAGSQADHGDRNKVSLLKITNLTRTSGGAEDEEDDENEDDEDSATLDPVVEARAFKHPGGVNRIRAMPQQPAVVATWADTGSVHFWNLSAHSASLDAPTELFEGNNKSMRAMLTFAGHGDEGFALDWSPITAGRAATGSCNGRIHLYQVDPTGTVTVDTQPFNVHNGASVEDIQWSPTEEHVFAAASTDGTVRIFDARAYARERHMLSVKCHDSDVNVIAWNKNGSGSLLASGGDDGRLRVWDLSNFSASASPADFAFHRKPITSLQWHPHDESVLVASGEDDMVTVWDLALEADDEAAAGAVLEDVQHLPPQLLFVHMGQTHIKEVHFHPQVPSMMLSTASEGIDIFKPANMDVLLPPSADAAPAA